MPKKEETGTLLSCRPAIRVLDATLRDGGLVNDFRFSDEFVRALAPSKRSVVLVKPHVGVSTARAYAAFDANPQYVSAEERAALAEAQEASRVALHNNLAPAAEVLVPELAEVRAWLEAQPGVAAAMLSGSGSATFAVCESLDVAFAVASAATKRGWWARATALSSARAAVVPR